MSEGERMGRENERMEEKTRGKVKRREGTLPEPIKFLEITSPRAKWARLVRAELPRWQLFRKATRRRRSETHGERSRITFAKKPNAPLIESVGSF